MQLTDDFSQLLDVAVQPLPHAGVQAGMLRLDSIHPLVSGNKWLKLAHWARLYQQGSYRGILTKGGPWSNHLYACAAWCHSVGIPLHAIVKAAPGTRTPTLDDVVRMGGQLTFVHRQAYYAEDTWAQQAAEQALLYIPMGGDGPGGMAGVQSWLQQAPGLHNYTTIMVSVGTGTTLLGIAHSGLPFTRLIGIDPGTGDTQLFDKIRSRAGAEATRLQLQRYPGKFGKGKEARLAFILHWHALTGIVLDWVYTAPMCMQFEQMLAQRQFEPGERVLLVHTGGLQGNRSQEALAHLT